MSALASGLVPSSTSQTGPGGLVDELSEIPASSDSRTAGPALSLNPACALAPGWPSLVKPAPAGAFVIDQHLARMKRMKTGVMTWARVCTEWTGTSSERWRATFVTLTYRDSACWGPKQITSYLACVASWAKRRGVRVPYTWVLELTKAGAPHYHVLLWVPRRFCLPKPDKAGWWSHGLSRIEATIHAAPHAYICKYLSKGTDVARLPRGSRISGRGGLPRQSQAAREARWWRLPSWLRELLPLDAGVLARRASAVLKAKIRGPGGRFFSWIAETGELFESPWASRFCPATRRLYIWRVA